MAVDSTTRSAQSGNGSSNGSRGGVPPHDLEAESSVLGAIMLAERWLDPLQIDIGLRPDDFYRERHRLIYSAILKLNAASEPIDTLTVAAQLIENGEIEEAGGKDYVETLVERIPALANTKQYGQIVKENALLRRLLQASQEIQESIASREGDPKELLERAQQRVFEVATDSQNSDFREIGDILQEELAKLEKQSESGSALTGTPSGFRDLDELTGGFQNGNLIIIAARPSMGKSALVTNMAENASLKGFPVALFSLEMSQSELAQRFVASQAKIDGDALRKGKIKKDRWPAVLKAAQELSEAPLWIDDSSDINILELRAKARRLHGKAMGANGIGLGMVIVDYLQLLRAEDGRDSRVEQVSQISRGLKILARELNIPVIAVSQLSRAVENRTPPRPQLSDLRECVTGDTLVNLADGSMVPILELVGTQPSVLALDESDRVINAHCDLVWSVGEKEVFELFLSSGKSIKATAGHRIRTRRGWVQLGDLESNDLVAVTSQARATSKSSWSRTSSSAPAATLVQSDPLIASEARLLWDDIAEIRFIGNEEVFDLTVPGPANWLADGIVTHNSGQIEQDADLVGFIYREDYYLREESQRPGEADIIIAKHRNGPVRDVALTFMSHYPKFSNLPRAYGGGQHQQGGPSAIAAAPVPIDDDDLDEL